MPRSQVDWQAVERDYRTGKFTQRQLAEMYGCSHVAINKRARQHAWTQDLTRAIRQATDAKVIEAAVAARVTSEVNSQVNDGYQKTVDTVLVAAEIAKDVILRHRSDIRATRDMAVSMLERFDRMKESISTPFDLEAAIKSVAKLADTFSKLQPLERKAFRMDEGKPDDGDNPLAALIAEIQARGSKPVIG